MTGRITDVRVTTTEMPPLFSTEWRPRHTECSCGFIPGKHPVCIACGVVIGPRHYERYGRMVEVPVFYDHFDDTVGLWEVGVKLEQRRICRGCARNIDQIKLALPNLRLHSRVRLRLNAINQWRKRRGLPRATFGTPFEAASEHFDAVSELSPFTTGGVRSRQRSPGKP